MSLQRILLSCLLALDGNEFGGHEMLIYTTGRQDWEASKQVDHLKQWIVSELSQQADMGSLLILDDVWDHSLPGCFGFATSSTAEGSGKGKNGLLVTARSPPVSALLAGEAPADAAAVNAQLAEAIAMNASSAGCFPPPPLQAFELKASVQTGGSMAAAEYPTSLAALPGVEAPLAAPAIAERGQPKKAIAGWLKAALVLSMAFTAGVLVGQRSSRK